MVQDNPTPAPVRIDSDEPAMEKFDFGFGVYADTLAGLIAGRENATPLVMGIYGPWGSGKTTLMNAISARLDGDRFGDADTHRQCKTVWFQPWKYDRDDEVLAAIIEAIFKAMAAQGFFTLAKDKVNAITRRIDQSAIFASVSKLVTGVDISEFFSQLPNKPHLGAYDTFFKFFDDLVWTFLNWRFKISDQEKPDDKKCALVIFVDDLDRCPPGRIVRVLETIKMFMARTGCIFVVGAARKTLENALAETCGPEDAGYFLDKIVPTAFTLPPLTNDALRAVLQNKPGGMSALVKFLPLVAPAVGHNPRQLKHFTNKMNLLYGLLRNSNVVIGFEKVLCWGIIELCFAELAAEINSDPQVLFTLQKRMGRLLAKPDGKPLWQISDRRLKSEKVPPEIHPYIKQPYLAEVVMRCSITAQDFDRLRFMSLAVNIDGDSYASRQSGPAAGDPPNPD